MSHATELIRQIIRKQGLYTIYPGQEESSFGDLLQTAWIQIERTLYKFRARPHCRPCFNPDRPNDSLLYLPGDLEYGIVTYDDLKRLGIISCGRCDGKIKADPVIEARQELYGGSASVLFRGNSKVFNMWSQIARTVILAHIKKEGRDRKNAPSYRDHVTRKIKHIAPEDGHVDDECQVASDEVASDDVASDDVEKTIKSSLGHHRDLMHPTATQLSDVMIRFLTEARDMCKYNEDHLCILNALENLLKVDDKPAEGIIGKLVEHSGLSRVVVTQFMKTIRLRSFEFTDSPIARADGTKRFDKRRIYGPGSTDDDE